MAAWADVYTNIQGLLLVTEAKPRWTNNLSSEHELYYSRHKQGIINSGEIIKPLTIDNYQPELPDRQKKLSPDWACSKRIHALLYQLWRNQEEQPKQHNIRSCTSNITTSYKINIKPEYWTKWKLFDGNFRDAGTVVFNNSSNTICLSCIKKSNNLDPTDRIWFPQDVPTHVMTFFRHVVRFTERLAQAPGWTGTGLSCPWALGKQFPDVLPDIIRRYFFQTLKALHYLKEEHGVIHRDVKPSNILLDERGNIKLCDFGISGRLVDSKAKTRSAGCAAYMAPERIDPPDPTRPDYDIRADVWSLGITLVELATGHFPYKDCRNDFEVLTKVLQDDPPVLPHDKKFSLEFCQFVNDCLIKNYQMRPKYKKLLGYTFIKQFESKKVDVSAWFSERNRITTKQSDISSLNRYGIYHTLPLKPCLPP
ncbi:unnamed protein product, partial [Meganyctiphanes norvegica]